MFLATHFEKNTRLSLPLRSQNLLSAFASGSDCTKREWQSHLLRTLFVLKTCHHHSTPNTNVIPMSFSLPPLQGPGNQDMWLQISAGPTERLRVAPWGSEKLPRGPWQRARALLIWHLAGLNGTLTCYLDFRSWHLLLSAWCYEPLIVTAWNLWNLDCFLGCPHHLTQFNGNLFFQVSCQQTWMLKCNS